MSRADPQEAMKSGPRGSTAGRGSGRLRSVLVSLEVGLSAACLIAGGLLLHSLANLLRVDRGFESQRVVTVDLNLPASRYTTLDQRTAFVRSLLGRVSVIPGVVSAGVSNVLPLGGEGGNNIVTVEGATMPLVDRPIADFRCVNPEYFRTLVIPLRAGRIFNESDTGRKVALVSSLTAERLWPGENPLGKRFREGDEQGTQLEVLGVIGDVRGVSLNRAPSLTVYTPYWQRSRSQVALAVRTSLDGPAPYSSVRAAIRQADPELPIPALRTMEEIVSESVSQRRFQMTLVLLFAVIALLLASLGIYGVVSYSVAQRTNEMGIRMALGARPTNISGMVLRQGLAPVAVGLGAGVVASLALGRILGSLLFGVSAGDPLTIAVVAALLGGVALVATCIPAHRATHVDPTTALRYE